MTDQNAKLSPDGAVNKTSKNAAGGGDRGSSGSNRAKRDASLAYKSTEIYESKAKTDRDLFAKRSKQEEKTTPRRRIIISAIIGVVLITLIVFLIIITISDNNQTESETVADSQEESSSSYEPSGGDFYYTNCELEDETLATNTEKIKSEVCTSVASAEYPEIWTYINKMEQATESLDDLDEVRLRTDLINTLIQYRANVVENDKTVSAKFDEKLMELAEEIDFVESSAASALNARYVAEVIGNTEKQAEYEQLYNERQDRGEESECGEEYEVCG